MPPPKKGPPPRRSLRTRLLAAALALVLAALVVAGLAIGVILHRFVRGQIEGHLDAQIVALRAGLEAGLLSQNRDAPPFDRDGPGWAWEVRRGAETYGSGSLRGGHITVTDPGPDDAADHPHPADGTGPRGERLILRILDVPGTPPATIIAAAPRAALYGPLREALTSLALALGVLGLCLIAGLALQVRLGLAPLRRLRADLAAVRAGRRERVPEEQPAEIKPLVAELNALLDQNAQNLERARGHVANLAHALKTPLATLSMALADRARDPDGALRLQVDDMDRRVRHHLRRARAAALAGSARGRTPLAPRVSDLRDALVRLYAEKGVAIDLAVPDALSVPCEGRISTRCSATSWTMPAAGAAAGSGSWPPARRAASWCGSRMTGRASTARPPLQSWNAAAAWTRACRATASGCRSPSNSPSSTAAGSPSGARSWAG